MKKEINIELTKKDIVEYFAELKCSNCPFKGECDYLDDNSESIASICSLFAAM